MGDGFYWVRAHKTGELAIVKARDMKWFVFGGLEGWWTENEIREGYDILCQIHEPIAGDTDDVVDSDRLTAAAVHQLTRGRRILAQNIREGSVDRDPVVRIVAANRRALEKRAADIARSQQKYEGSDFPVCQSIARMIERTS
jgi:hypothetical protein